MASKTTAAKDTKTADLSKEEMLEAAKRLTRQRKYRKQYNAGTYITDKEVVVIGDTEYMKYKAGGTPKMRLVREGEDIADLKRTVIS